MQHLLPQLRWGVVACAAAFTHWSNPIAGNIAAMSALFAATLTEQLGMVFGFYLANTVAGIGFGFLLERALAKKRIWVESPAPGQYRHELVGNLVFLAVLVLTSTAAVHWSVVRFGPDSFGRGCATFAAMYFGFQAYLYLLHRALHLPWLVRFHRWHHVSRVTTPLTGQSMGAVEAVGWAIGYLLLPAGLSLVAPLSVVGLLAYLSFNILGNMIGHANVEAAPPAPGLYYRSLVAAVFVYHALHHLRWTGHYGFASTWADRLFGTEWPDWMPLYEQVSAGQPVHQAQVRKPAEKQLGA